MGCMHHLVGKAFYLYGSHDGVPELCLSSREGFWCMLVLDRGSFNKPSLANTSLTLCCDCHHGSFSLDSCRICWIWALCMTVKVVKFLWCSRLSRWGSSCCWACRPWVFQPPLELYHEVSGGCEDLTSRQGPNIHLGTDLSLVKGQQFKCIQMPHQSQYYHLQGSLVSHFLDVMFKAFFLVRWRLLSWLFICRTFQNLILPCSMSSSSLFLSLFFLNFLLFLISFSHSPFLAASSWNTLDCWLSCYIQIFETWYHFSEHCTDLATRWVLQSLYYISFLKTVGSCFTYGKV